MAGSPTGATGSAGSDGAPSPAPTPAATPPAEPTGPAATGQPGAADAPPNQSGPAGSSPEVAALRAELAEAHSKAERARQDIAEQIATALGITDGQAPTVEEVTEQLTAAQHEARERAVDLAVYRAAPAAGADPDALLDSASFRRRVADLDPTADAFADQVTAAIAEAIKANPRLGAAPAAAPRSGGQITGGPPTGGEDLGALSVEDYIKRTRKRGN